MSKFLNLVIGFAAVVIVLLGVARFSLAEETAIKTSDSTTTEVGNKFCPISGDKIKPGKEYKVEYKGKVYNFCCSMCEKDFKKDPEAAIQKLESISKEKDEGKEEGMTDMDGDDDGDTEAMPETNRANDARY